MAKTFDFQCHHERNGTQNVIVHMYCIGNINTMWMQNCYSKLIADAGDVGFAKYAGMEQTNLQVGILIGFEFTFPPRYVAEALVTYIYICMVTSNVD